MTAINDGSLIILSDQEATELEENKGSFNREDKLFDKERKDYLRETYRQKLKGREKYGSLIAIIVISWLIISIAVLVLQGFNISNFSISDTVLTAWISGVSVNVIGLFYIVIKFIFSE